MEAQALGAVPIFSPTWALNDNVAHGISIKGDPDAPLTRARFLAAVLRLTRDLDLQESVRRQMMPWARDRFNWERVADEYEFMAADYPDCLSCYAQYAFQLRHAKGRVLNIGCNCDDPGFGDRGGVNVDINETDAWTKIPNRAHVIADARNSLPFGREFDTVILGDILEHMTDADAVASLRNARQVVRPDGRILVTVPEDYRGIVPDQPYADGVAAGHQRPITREIVRGWLGRAGLREALHQPIDYGDFHGHGVIACDTRVSA